MQRRRQPTGGIHPLLMGGRMFKVPTLGSIGRFGADPINSRGQAYIPYSEDPPIFNGAGVGGTDPNLNPPPVGLLPSAGTGWKNPNTFSSVPILAGSSAVLPILTLNYQRNALMIQNNSTATAPDTTPIFYIGFNAPVPSVGFGLALAAGVGIAWDYITPRDSIFILQGPFVNGGTTVVAGVVVQGTFAPSAG